MPETKQMKKALIRSLGCKVNQSEASAMAALLKEKGYVTGESESEPDLVIVNTCCVTSRAEGKSRRLIANLLRRHPRARFIATGCLAQLDPDSLEDLSYNLTCLDTGQKDRFTHSLDQALDGMFEGQKTDPETLRDFGELNGAITPERSRATLKIQDGCDQKCAYCVVPYTRGASRSMPIERVIEAAGEMEAGGAREIVLSGIHIGYYGKDLDTRTNLEDLLETLLARYRKTRFRISSCEPQEITPELIAMMSRYYPRLCRHLHIPLQSGSDRILERMGRPYDSRFVHDLLQRALSRIPDLCVGLDMMVGFPGEGPGDFQKTLEFAKEYPLAYLHIFPFSPRPDTPAALMEDPVDPGIVKERVEELQTESARLRVQFYESCKGKVFQGVVERMDQVRAECVARTDNYIPARVIATELGPNDRIIDLKITDVESNGAVVALGQAINLRGQ
jgi:threonylcarbamoyladenosine tRNA methylthiotransferase MtaB